MKKMKNDNKGFTLVELIVVLVILAILAAILVPALLGYIDEAKNKQIVLHGKSVYTAAQAVASELYAKDKGTDLMTAANFPSCASLDGSTATLYTKKILDMADISSFTLTKGLIKIGLKEAYPSTGSKHGAYTISYVYYQEEAGKGVELVDGIWNSVSEPTASPSGTAGTILEILNK